MEHQPPDWQPIATLPEEEGRFVFRWADGEERELDGYCAVMWVEDRVRDERPVEWRRA
jgi:hypothetical protein